MKTDTLKQYFGSVEAASDCLGISRQGIYWWKGEVPRDWQIIANIVSDGEIKLPQDTQKELARMRVKTKAVRAALTRQKR